MIIANERNPSAMKEKYLSKIAMELSIRVEQVRNTAALLTEGGTVPFIARYRKEATNSLDEVAITSIRDRLSQLAELDARREAIVKSLEERGLMTEELRGAVAAADTLADLEDVYLPYRPKRRTRAMIAREKGLDPLARLLLKQGNDDVLAAAAAYIDAEKGVPSAEDALAGARDIIAEIVSEDQPSRARVRQLYRRKAAILCKAVKGKEELGAKYKDYFEWTENARHAPSHRILAIFRGENEGVLSARVVPPEEDVLQILDARFVRGKGGATDEVIAAVRDGCRRLLTPSLETEFRAELKQRADDEAIRVFADNLRELLLASPLGQKNVLAVDPGFRTGCKVVVLDRQGALLCNDTIFPHQSDRQRSDAENTVRKLVEKHHIEAIAVGNGTAGRETEDFLQGLGLPNEIPIVMVNESGASIYSASEVAREEFPDHDVTVRGAVSIGRRLMDPLAELVKLDPKSIGVGQYQHDVDQKALRRSLDDVTMSCVNSVGVEVNTASHRLLSYVAGLGPQIARNILTWRSEKGPFASRAQLRKVPRLGPKAFEQCAGFLRIQGASNPLDASAVHPESYPIVDAMARDLGCSVLELTRDAELRRRIAPNRYITEHVGLPTLNDILEELAKPGRDPRRQFEVFHFAKDIHDIKDLAPGMKLAGIVTNVTAFGAFVDVGVHQDGLVHISQLADRFVKNPSEIVNVGQRVSVTVVDVDLPRRRIALSMKSIPNGKREKGITRKTS